MDLHTKRGHIDTDIGCKAFGQRREKASTVRPELRVCPLGRMAHVDCVSTGVSDGAGNLRQRLHGEQHALHIGVLDDRAHALLGISTNSTALFAFLGVVQCLLIGSFRYANALNTNQETRIVHHSEHAGETAIFFANQIANCSGFFPLRKAVTIDHSAGRGGVNPHFVFKA